MTTLDFFFLILIINWPRWHIPLVLALRRQRQADLCEFKASLVYRESSRTARATQRNPVSQNKTKKENKYKPSSNSLVRINLLNTAFFPNRLCSPIRLCSTSKDNSYNSIYLTLDKRVNNSAPPHPCVCVCVCVCARACVCARSFSHS